MLRYKILKILEDNCMLSPNQISIMVDTEVENVKKLIDDAKNDGTLLGYRALINWNKSDIDEATALIELKITPQQDKGFDAVAEKIYRHPQDESLYLLSGGFDMMVTSRGRSLKKIASFVSGTLATIYGVISTATHFILKRYKDNNTIFDNKSIDNRQVIS